MPTNKCMNIFVALDENFANHLLVLVKSIKAHNHNNIHLFIGVSDARSLDFLTEVKNQASGTLLISINKINIKNMQHLWDTGMAYFPPESYFRLLVWTIIPQDIDKILYLDTDTLVNGDLSELYHYKQTKTILGVSDPCYKVFAQKYLQKIVPERPIHTYINAGVLLIDLVKWRKLNLEKEMLQFLTQHFNQLYTLDQELLNIFFQNEIECIDARWNFFEPSIINRPIIYHMVGRWKWDSSLHWNYFTKKLYRYYLSDNCGLVTDMWDMITYITLGRPLNVFLNAKHKMRYKYAPMGMRDYFWIMCILYPPIFIIFCRGVMREWSKRGTWEIIRIILWIFQ